MSPDFDHMPEMPASRNESSGADSEPSSQGNGSGSTTTHGGLVADQFSLENQASQVVTDAVVAAAGQGSVEDLEVKDAHVIFNTVWNDLEEEIGHENLRFTKELILLGGAPGSGKGTNSEFIAKVRGLTCPPIIVSDLLNTPEANRIKEAGGMVGDTEVVGILFRKLLEEEYRDGCILDGFPRTRVQVECLHLLVQKMNQLYREYHTTPLAINFRKPTVHAVVLFIDEKTSIERQLLRGRQIAEHNERVALEGDGEIIELRPTDLDPIAAKRRYRVFKEKTWDALQSLKQIYHYHFVDADGAIADVERKIRSELDYQSSLELDPETYDAVRGLPLATEIGVHARQELVRRLDSYELEHRELFHQVIAVIAQRFMPIVQRHAIAGLSIINSEDHLFDDPLALAMVIDIFAERGFRTVANINLAETPDHFDLKTGKITCTTKKIFRFQVRFEGSEIRRGGR
ncbi:nucleoside monophosphate kinase [Rhodopirellula sp. SWK7]|uniref:nucleoside monophosphate kinase n=1 Tax=Rhodopirellula sp. SWK7 TaxID=595460 RepID=UPI0002BF6D0E|nr:nucleoside monophosphate kinase [Rhodopirellula sp. SWK7]EMI42458.1 adenylate kinase [Rhodopirellula sp. SWK7]